MPTNALRLLSRAAPLLASAALALAACKTTYDYEDRDTPVHVLLEAPAAARGEVSLPVLVYVGDHKAVDRVVRFPAGTTLVTTPTLHLRAGEPEVSVVLQGRAVATSKVKVHQPTWILIRIEGLTASIASSNQDPSAAR